MITAIGIFFFIVGLISLYNAIQNIKANKKLHEARMTYIRAQQVLLFRETMLEQYDMDIYNSMPTFEEMLEDKKDLTFANYVKIDRVINMN